MARRSGVETERAEPGGSAVRAALAEHLLDGTTDWLFAKDLEHRYLCVNHAFAQAVGRPREAIVGRLDTEIWPRALCEGDPARGLVGYHECDRRAFAGETVRTPDEPATLPDGRTRTFDTIRKPFRDADGAVIGVLCYSRDVTEQRGIEQALVESEQRLRHIIASVPGSVYRAEYRFPYRDMMISRGVEALTGYPEETFLAPGGPSFGGLTLLEDAPEVDRAVEKAVTNRSVYDLRYRIRHADGSLRWVHDRGRATYGADGTPLWIDGVILDITDQAQAEAVLREQEERLQAFQRQLHQAMKMEALGTLAGGIAHDFNNILSGLLGAAEVLRGELGAEHAGQRSVDLILDEGLRARELVRQILAFSEQEEAERRPIRLGPVIADSMALMRAALPASVSIRFDRAERDIQVLADVSQLQQVMMNLCINASQAMPRGGEITVTERSLDAGPAGSGPVEGKPCIEIAVRDTGTGMDSSTISRIFDPFFTTKGPGEGTGLGLAVVQRVLHSHGGAVLVESTPAVGSVFRLYFPVTRPEAPAVEVPRGRGQHILLVDDEQAILTVTGILLTRLGYRVTSYHEPARALNDLRQRPGGFDLALVDLTMPGMDGTSFTRSALEIQPDLPVVLCSGYTGLDQNQARTAGIRDTLTKPYSRDTLAAVVARHLRTTPVH